MRQRQTNTRAFTLMELMVATVVLTILVYAVGLLVTKAKTTVVNTQAKLRANAAAAGIAHVIRADFYKLSKLGFLRIDKDSMSFTVAGDIQSVSGTARGNGGIVMYGLCKNNGLDVMGNDLLSKIFFRRMLILDATNRSGEDRHPDSIDFADIQMAKDVTSFIPDPDPAVGDVPSGLKVPVVSLADVMNLWQVLAVFCEQAENEAKTAVYPVFSYLDPDPTSPSYGKWRDGGAKWNIETKDYDLPSVWTKNHTRWPTAIKIRFAIEDPGLPASVQLSGYEIIVPVGAG